MVLSSSMYFQPASAFTRTAPSLLPPCEQAYIKEDSIAGLSKWHNSCAFSQPLHSWSKDLIHMFHSNDFRLSTYENKEDLKHRFAISAACHTPSYSASFYLPRMTVGRLSNCRLDIDQSMELLVDWPRVRLSMRAWNNPSRYDWWRTSPKTRGLHGGGSTLGIQALFHELSPMI